MSLKKTLLATIMMLCLGLTIHTGKALAAKPNTMKGCKECHTPDPNVVRGKKLAHSEKFKTLQVDVGSVVWVIQYDNNTLLKGADSLAALKKGKEISVTYKGTEKSPVATAIFVKQPFKVPDKQLVSVEEMLKLSAAGPEKGGFLLVDSRPPAAYNSGHIPDAVSIPFPKLKKMGAEILPKDKNARVIFYCGGFT